MHLLNKRRPGRPQGQPAAGSGPRDAAAPGGGGRAGPRPRLEEEAAAAQAPSARAAGPTLPHACDPDAGRERAVSPRRRWRWPAKPGLEPGPLRESPCPPPPRARAHTKRRQLYLRTNSASLPSLQTSLPSQQPELGDCVIDGSS